jgi:hypothetical protein
MGKSLYEVVKEFYGNATKHERGQSILTTPYYRKNLGKFVFNFNVNDGEPLHFMYTDGQLIVKKGLGDAGPGGLNIDAEITTIDLWEILEGRLLVHDATLQRKIYIKSSAPLEYNERPYFILWAMITKVGQDLVISDKVKSLDRWQ